MSPAWACDGGEDDRGAWAELRLGDAALRLRWIPPGVFVQGSPADEGPGRFEDEGPQREVTLTNGFWLGETAVTQALYEEVLGENPSRFRSARRPVDGVTWFDARRFCEALGAELPELDARLPTEAEWEYACRAGTTAPTWRGAFEELGMRSAPALDAIGWYGGNAGVDFDLESGWDVSDWEERHHAFEFAGTREVGLKPPNPWGLYDMLGNVWEWCLDEWADYPPGPCRDPNGPSPRDDADSQRVLRGGCWFNNPGRLRAAARHSSHPETGGMTIGFRLVCS